MATTIDKFDSTGGFSIARTAVIDDLGMVKISTHLKLKIHNTQIAIQQHIF